MDQLSLLSDSTFRLFFVFVFCFYRISFQTARYNNQSSSNRLVQEFLISVVSPLLLCSSSLYLLIANIFDMLNYREHSLFKANYIYKTTTQMLN